MTRTCSECPCLDRERKYGRIFWCRRRECYVPPQMDACGYRKVFEPLRDEVRRLRAKVKTLASDLMKTNTLQLLEQSRAEVQRLQKELDHVLTQARDRTEELR